MRNDAGTKKCIIANICQNSLFCVIAVPVDDKDVNISEDVSDTVCVVVAVDVAVVVSCDVNSTII